MPEETVFACRIKGLRGAKGLTRRAVAERLGVDVTAISAWERGRYRPRDPHSAALAALLGCSVEDLFSEALTQAQPVSARVIDTVAELDDLLPDLLANTRHSLKALRIAAPYSTPAHVQREFRLEISRRLLAKEIELQRVEVFYTLERLKESLSNIFRYDRCPYWIKSYCPGLREVAPAMGGYLFDDDRFLIGAYWTGVPPHNQPGLLLSGEPFSVYFKAYWNEIWRRGTLLNPSGRHDLSVVRYTAFALGLAKRDWPRFVKEARNLKIGDSAPPLI